MQRFRHEEKTIPCFSGILQISANTHLKHAPFTRFTPKNQHLETLTEKTELQPPPTLNHLFESWVLFGKKIRKQKQNNYFDKVCNCSMGQNQPHRSPKRCRGWSLEGLSTLTANWSSRQKQNLDQIDARTDLTLIWPWCNLGISR